METQKCFPYFLFHFLLYRDKSCVHRKAYDFSEEELYAFSCYRDVYYKLSNF